MSNPNKIVNNILGKKLNAPSINAKPNKKDWDGDGVPNKKDCQPKNSMRQDNLTDIAAFGLKRMNNKENII